MHVDGFRFDLATTLGRELHEVDKLRRFFDIIHQDPVLSQVKLIAEPWDVGRRAATRSATSRSAGRSGTASIATACARSGKATAARRASSPRGSPAPATCTSGAAAGPHASINFITCHDGFTLHDLVTYDKKHNEANGEDNRDGTNDNISWNCGVEGPTDDPEIIALRERQKRNLLATLLFSQGVPMLLAGDEFGPHAAAATTTPIARTTRSAGWTGSSDPRQELLEFVRRLIPLRTEHPPSRTGASSSGRS